MFGQYVFYKYLSLNLCFNFYQTLCSSGSGRMLLNNYLAELWISLKKNIFISMLCLGVMAIYLTILQNILCFSTSLIQLAFEVHHLVNNRSSADLRIREIIHAGEKSTYLFFPCSLFPVVQGKTFFFLFSSLNRSTQ